MKTEIKKNALSLVTVIVIAGSVMAGRVCANEMLRNPATCFVGPGLDWSSWNGAVLGGPNGALWGVRIGWVENNTLVTGMEFEKRVKRPGPYAAAGAYAKLFSDLLTVTWAAEDPQCLVARVDAIADADIVVEAYPAHDFMHLYKEKLSLKKTPPGRYENPCRFEAPINGLIRGWSPKVNVVAGTCRTTGGNQKVTGRAQQIEPESAGLSHFLLQVLPLPEESGHSPTSPGADFTIRHDRSAWLRWRIHKGDTIRLVARTAAAPLADTGLKAQAIDEIISRREGEYAATRMYGTGSLGDMSEPMLHALCWNVLWNPFEQMRWVSPGRGWMYNGLYNAWGWDEHFVVNIADLIDPDLARNNLRMGANDLRVGPYAAWYLYARHGDIELLRKSYDFFRNLVPPRKVRKTEKGPTELSKLNLWGWIGFGMDDTPMKEKWAQKKKGPMFGVDGACYQALNADILARMADALNRTEEAAAYRAYYSELTQVINEVFWNEEAGTYRNRYANGEWPVTESPTSFYPWIAGVVPPDRSKRLLAHLFDERTFWTQWVIPTLPRNDPQYGKPLPKEEKSFLGVPLPPFTYWRGAVWPSPNYLVYEGMKRAGLDREAAVLANKCVALWRKNWVEKGIFPENFNPETGGRCDDTVIPKPMSPYSGTIVPMSYPHQSWSMLLPFIGVKELIDSELWGDIDTLRFGSMDMAVSSVENYLWRGHRWGVTSGGGSLTLKRDGNDVFRAKGGVCVVRAFKLGGQDAALCSCRISAESAIQVWLRPDHKGPDYTLDVGPGQHVVRVDKTGPVLDPVGK